MRLRQQLGTTRLSAAQIAGMLPALDGPSDLATGVWHLMGNEFSWEGFRVICEVHDLQDPETLLANLHTIRLHLADNTKNTPT